MNQETIINEQKPQTKGLVSLITGIGSIVLSCLFPLGIAAGIVAMIFGNQSRNTDNRGKYGFILGIIGAALSLVIGIVSLIILITTVFHHNSTTTSGNGGWTNAGNISTEMMATEHTTELIATENTETSMDASSETTEAGDTFDNVVTSSYTPAYETMEVGDDTVGYCLVPSNFSHFIEVGGTMLPNAVQYAYGYIVIGMQSGDVGLTAADFNYALNEIAKENPDVDSSSIVSTKESINGIAGYKRIVYYPADDMYLITFTFDGEDGILHYISVEYPASETEYSDLFETVVYNYHY